MILRFLSELPNKKLELFNYTDLPFAPHTLFCGSLSSSGLQPGFPRENIWMRQTDERQDTDGFPAFAQLVMLPGLTQSALLSVLAKQKPEIIYTKPIRTLLDAMRYNGIAKSFYRQMITFLVLVACYTSFVWSLGGMSSFTDPRERSFVIRAGALLVSRTCPDASLSHDNRFVWAMLAGCASFLLSAYYLLRELNELLDVSSEEDAAGDDGGGDRRKHSSVPTWHARLYDLAKIGDGWTDHDDIAPIRHQSQNAHIRRFEVHFPREKAKKCEHLTNSDAADPAAACEVHEIWRTDSASGGNRDRNAAENIARSAGLGISSLGTRPPETLAMLNAPRPSLYDRRTRASTATQNDWETQLAQGEGDEPRQKQSLRVVVQGALSTARMKFLTQKECETGSHSSHLLGRDLSAHKDDAAGRYFGASQADRLGASLVRMSSSVKMLGRCVCVCVCVCVCACVCACVCVCVIHGHHLTTNSADMCMHVRTHLCMSMSESVSVSMSVSLY